MPARHSLKDSQEQDELLLVMQAGRSFVLPYATAGVVAAAVVAPVVPLAVLVSWGLLYMLYIGYRIVLTTMFHSAGLEKQRALHRHWWFFINASGFLHGLMWAVFCLVTFPYLNQLHQIAITCFIVIAGAFATTYVSSTVIGFRARVITSHLGLVAAWLVYGETLKLAVNLQVGAMMIMYLLAGNRQRLYWRRHTVMARENERLAQALEEKNRQLDAALKRQTGLLAVAGHDLRQPIHAIGLAAECLRPGDDAVLQEEQFAAIRERIDDMGDMVNSLLDLSRLEYGTYVIRSEPVDVVKLLQQMTADLLPRASKQGLTLTVSAAGPLIVSDPLLLRRMIWNLITNAIKFTDRGSVIASYAQEPGGLRIAISDTGRGLQKSVRTTASTKGGDSFNEVSKGMGFGLAIVERSAEVLRYDLSIESAVDGGTVVSLLVPLSAAVATEISPAFGARWWQEAPPATSPAGVTSHDGQGACVVLIEDEPLALGSMAKILGDLNYQVVTASSGAMAREKIDALTQRPGLVISDLYLGYHAEGFELVQWIRQKFGPHYVPAIILTGDVQASTIELAHAGDVELLRKPLRLKTLPGIVRQAIGGKQWRQAPAG